ncbi:MAG: EamA/RhaT family transporter [Rhizobium sp.]|nr:EamA/RhaT family transporter [Rhizobium sp.]
MDPRREHRLGLIFVVLAAITWSSAGFFTRLIALDYPTMIAGRGIFGAIGMLVLIIAFDPRHWTYQFRNMGWPDVVYILNYVFGTLCYISSLGLTSIAHNSVIFATIPFISALLGWLFLREIPSVHAIGASAIAILGVMIMVGFGADGGVAGDVLSFAGTASMAASIILVRKYRTIAITACACIASFISGVIALPFAELSHVTSLNFTYLVLFGLLNASAGLTLFSLGSKRLPAVETALISTLDTPLAPFWVWLAFNEIAGPQTVIGGLLVLFAVILHIYLSQRRPNAAM